MHLGAPQKSQQSCRRYPSRGALFASGEFERGAYSEFVRRKSPACAGNERMTLRLLRLPDVCAQVGLRPTSIYSRVKNGTLPPPIALASRSRAWPEHEIEAIVGSIIAGRNDDDIRTLVRDLVAQRSGSAPARQKTAQSSRDTSQRAHRGVTARE